MHIVSQLERFAIFFLRSLQFLAPSCVCLCHCRFSGATASAGLTPFCSLWLPGIQRMLVPCLHSKSGVRSWSLGQFPEKRWTYVLPFSFFPKGETASWASLLNHAELCWLGGKAIMVAVEWLFSPVLLRLFLILSLPGVL